MITRTVKTSWVEYTVFNRETDEVKTLMTHLFGTFADEDSIKKALKIQVLDDDIILKAKVYEVTTEKYGMSLDEFVLTAKKLDD